MFLARLNRPQERSLVHRLAALWEVDAKELAAIERWVKRYRELAAEAQEMIAASRDCGAPSR